jgi:hypothetical protein
MAKVAALLLQTNHVERSLLELVNTPLYVHKATTDSFNLNSDWNFSGLQILIPDPPSQGSPTNRNVPSWSK